MVIHFVVVSTAWSVAVVADAIDDGDYADDCDGDVPATHRLIYQNNLISSRPALPRAE